MRKLVGSADVYGRIANFNALRIAASKAVLGKRKKPGASTFFANCERRAAAAGERTARPQLPAGPLRRDPGA